MGALKRLMSSLGKVPTCPRCSVVLTWPPPNVSKTKHPPTEATIDHIVPVSWGGRDGVHRSNLQLLCRKCHDEKNDLEARLLLLVMAGTMTGPEAKTTIQKEWTVSPLGPSLLTAPVV